MTLAEPGAPHRAAPVSRPTYTPPFGSATTLVGTGSTSGLLPRAGLGVLATDGEPGNDRDDLQLAGRGVDAVNVIAAGISFIFGAGQI